MAVAIQQKKATRRAKQPISNGPIDGIPLDIALSLLSDERLVKLIRYVRTYTAKYGVSCQNFLTACECELLRRGLVTPSQESEV